MHCMLHVWKGWLKHLYLMQLEQWAREKFLLLWAVEHQSICAGHSASVYQDLATNWTKFLFIGFIFSFLKWKLPIWDISKLPFSHSVMEILLSIGGGSYCSWQSGSPGCKALCLHREIFLSLGATLTLKSIKYTDAVMKYHEARMRLKYLKCNHLNYLP